MLENYKYSIFSRKNKEIKNKKKNDEKMWPDTGIYTCYCYTKFDAQIWTKLYYFRETRAFVRKSEIFDKLEVPQSSIFFAEILHTYPT